MFEVFHSFIRYLTIIDFRQLTKSTNSMESVNLFLKEFISFIIRDFIDNQLCIHSRHVFTLIRMKPSMLHLYKWSISHFFITHSRSI